MRLGTTALAFGLVALLIESPSALGQNTPPASPPARRSAQSLEQVSPEGPAPRLELSRTEWDFGAKWHGEPCSTDITIANVGEAPLRIIRIRSSCGCTVARPKKRELLPGESDSMTLSYNTKKRTRKVSQTITLETNDPQRPRTVIRVKGEVKQVFEAKPADRITFGRIERDAVATQSIELRNNMEEEIFLRLKPFSDPPPFEVKLEAIEPGMVYKLSAMTKPPLKLGANTAKIVLETGLEKFPSITIPASVYVAPRVAVAPRVLAVTPRVTKPLQRIVRVTYRPDQPVQIQEIRSSHPDLITAELMPPRPARPNMVMRYHTIRVSLPAYDEMPEGGAKLEVFTDDPSPEYQKLVVDIQRRAPSRARRPTRPKPVLRPMSKPPESGAEQPEPKAGAPKKEEKPAKPKGEEKGEAGAPG
ncbi:MAG: DUF1573 domain-containing protein [Phycisphaerae bacterium]